MDEEDPCSAVGVEDLERISADLVRDFDGTCLLIANEVASSPNPVVLLEIVKHIGSQQQETGEEDADEDSGCRWLPDDIFERFEEGFLPQVAQLVLRRHFDRECVKHVNSFLQFVLVKVKHKLLSGDPSLLHSLAQILDEQKQFYAYHGISFSEEDDKENEGDVDEESGPVHPQFAVVELNPYVSVYFLQNLQFWGEIGGFSIFLTSLRSIVSDSEGGEDDMVFSFEAIQSIFRTLYAVKDHLASTFLLQYFYPFCDSLRFFMENVSSAEFHSLLREWLLEAGEVMELVLVKVLQIHEQKLLVCGGEVDDEDEITADLLKQSVQYLRLEILLRQFRSSSLEKRIYGLSEIVLLITRQFNEQVQEQPNPTASSLMEKLQYLVTWLHEKKIMEDLFGEKLHAELIKRSVPLFQFVSELECLNFQWLDLVWNCYGDSDTHQLKQRHEAHRMIIQDLLMEIVEFIYEPQLRHLFLKLQRSSMTDAGQLALLGVIAARSSSFDDSEVSEGSTHGESKPLREQVLMHLWETVISNVLSESMVDQVLEQMEEIVRRDARERRYSSGDESEDPVDRSALTHSSTASELVESLLRACIDNIRQRQQILVSLKLFTRLALMTTELKWQLPTLAATEQVSVAEILLSEMVNYKATLGNSSSFRKSDEQASTYRHPGAHLTGVKMRLLALRAAWMLEVQLCLHSHSSSPLARSQLDLVWRLLIEEAVSTDEASLCFNWIAICMNTSVSPTDDKGLTSENSSLLPSQLVEYLLVYKFSAMPGDRVTLPTLCCFHSLFRYLNLQNGGLQSYAAPASDDDDECNPSSSDGVVDLVTGKSLIGLEQLWHLAVQSRNSEVAEECITLLASFYLEFVPELRGLDISLQKKLEFVETCMGFLASAKLKVDRVSEGAKSDQNDEDSFANVATVNRCIDMLRYFLDACDAALEDSDAIAYRGSSDALNSTSSGESLSVREHSLSEELKLKRRVFEIENLEERLQHLEIYPSPMKETQLVSAAQTEALLNPSRRPSWTFRQHHVLLDAIPDEDESEVSEESGVPSRWPGRRKNSEGLLFVSPATDADRLKFSPEELPVSPRGSLLLPGRFAMKSPTVRVRPNLQWPQDVSPQRGPDLSLEDISKALQEIDCEGSGELQSEVEVEIPFTSQSSKPKYSIMSQILANEDTYFDTLLELVDWNDATSQRTWELICRLPTNNELLRKMIRLRPSVPGTSEDVVWSDLLNTTNIHRLLYALRLIEALLLPVEDAGNTSADQPSDSARRQWRERFVRLGGVEHLYETLLRWESIHVAGQSGVSSSVGVGTAYTSNLVATCLAAVIRTLHYFIQVHRSKSIYSRRGVHACAFDVRLTLSTLPAFMRSISLGSLGQSAVRLTYAYSSSVCTSSSSSRAAGNGMDDSMSAQTDEAIQCGVQLFTDVAALNPGLLVDGIWNLQSENQRVPSLIKWIKSMLLDCPSVAARSTALRSLIELTTETRICNSISVFIEQLVRGLSGLLVDSASDNLDQQQLFSFLNSLLSDSVPRLEKASRESIVVWLSKNAIPQRLLSRLYDRVSQTSTDKDTICGYLTLLRPLVLLSDSLRVAFLNYHPARNFKEEDLSVTSQWTVDFLLKDLLFGNLNATVNSDQDDAFIVPKCKSDQSRELAQALLFTLLSPTPESLTHDPTQTITAMANHVLQIHDNFQKSVLSTLNARGRPWNFAPQELLQDAESEIYHAGLVNPGCICYMNALVQQLFMIPSFREGLLSIDCKPTDSSHSQWSDEIAQLQKLFVSLAFTNFKSFDPTAFALSHRDLDGNPTDLRVQMDADEFFCVLLDRIDTSLRSADHQQPHRVEPTAVSSQTAANFLENCFGGVLVNQIITQQGHISEREEKFFALSLEVSKKQHLKDSLALYVEGESLDGENAYFCERLQQKVSATKRICIKKLPQTLVCHLKRFEFDFDTMEKLKINDYLEFPQEINMFPFTSEALSAAPDQLESAEEADSGEHSMMYDLVGVVVHSGTSDMGHYYSFIKDRAHPQRWLEFNDEVVREFEIEMIGDECFGGEEVKQHWEGNSRVSKLQMKRRNAYMLIYERRVELAAVLPQEQREQAQVANASRPSIESVNESLQRLINEMCGENTLFQSVVDAFGPTYCRFVEMLVDQALSLPSDPSRTSSEPEKKLWDWDGNFSELPSDCTSLQACVLGCQYLFGMASLQSSSVDHASLHSQNNLLKRVLEWVATEDPAADAEEVFDKCVFSAWLLRQTIASPSSSQENMSVARSWIFDVTFLNESNPDLVDGFVAILSVSVSILTKQVVAEDDNKPSEESSYRTVLIDFYQVLLNLFHDREQSIELADPTTGGAMTLSTTAVVSALTRIGTLLEICVCSKFADSSEEQAMTHQIFITNLQYFDRLLFTLQVEQKDPMSPESLYGHVSSSSATLDGSGISQVRLCTLEIEKHMVRELLSSIFNEPSDMSSPQQLQYQSRRPRIPVDANLVLNQTALANMLKYNLHEELTPVLVQIAERGSGSQRDKLLSLLMTVLEDVKTTYLEQMFHVFHALLDAEESSVQSEVGSRNVVERVPIHQHVFSASKGVLEGAAYYKDHRILYEYTFQLLVFCVNRAKSSQLLQQLFKLDEDLLDQVPWIVESMTKYLDPTGIIRRGEHTKKADESPDEDNENETATREILCLLEGIEKAFDCSVFIDEDSSMVHSERPQSLSQHELPEYEDSDVNQSVDDEQDALSLEDVVPEFAEESHDLMMQHASKFSVMVKEKEQGPEVEDEDEDDRAFNNLAPSPRISEKKYSVGPEFTPRNATRAASRAFAMREFMYNNRGNEA